MKYSSIPPPPPNVDGPLLIPANRCYLFEGYIICTTATATNMDNAPVVPQLGQQPQQPAVLPMRNRVELELAPLLPQASVRDRAAYDVAASTVGLHLLGDGDVDPLVDYLLDSYGDVLAQVAQASQRDTNSTIERVYQQNAADDAFVNSVLVPEHRGQQQSAYGGQQVIWPEQISAATAEEQQKQRDRATVENWQVGGGGGGGGGRGAQAPEVKQLGGGEGDGGDPQATKKPKDRKSVV